MTITTGDSKQEYGKVYPSKIMAYEGTELIVVHCISYTKVTWFSPKQKVIPEAERLGNDLVLKDLKIKDSGNYTCTGSTLFDIFIDTLELMIGC